MKIRIAILDDHTLVRTGLRLLIDSQPDMQVVGEAANVTEVFNLLAIEKPDVITLDIHLPDGNGLELLQKIVADFPDIRCIMLTMHDNSQFFKQAVMEGAAGYVVKTAADRDLLQAIRTVYSGKTYFHLSVSRPTPKPVKIMVESPDNETALLTEREREVVGFVANGHTSQEIADKLFLSRKTIETYRAKIMEKLGFSRRVDLVRFAMRKGMVPKNPDGFQPHIGKTTIADS